MSTHTITTTTYNVRFGNDPEKVGADLYRLAAHNDVIVCQEAWPDKYAGVWSSLPPGFRAVHLPATGADELVIVYNASRLTLSHAQARQLLAHVDSPEAGIAKARYALAATFTAPDGQPLTIVDTHMPLGHGARLDAALAALSGFVHDLGGRVIVGADWNTDLRRPNAVTRHMVPAGLSSAYSVHAPRGATIGRSLFDGFYGNVAAVRSWIGRGFSSDHKPASTTWRL